MKKKIYFYILGIIGIFVVLTSLPLIFEGQAAQESVTIYIYKGWNIISSPFEEPLNLSEIAKSCDLITYKGKIWAWTYNPVAGWTQPTQVGKNEGVYILSKENCTVKLTGTPATFSSRSLERGWNLISAEKSFEEIKGDCQIPSGYKIWVLNPQTQQWVNPATTEKLDQRQGYWVAVKNNCTLSVSEEECTKGSECPTGYYCRESDHSCQSLPECKVRNENGFGYSNVSNDAPCSGTPGKCCFGVCDNDGTISHSDYHSACRSGPSCLASGDWGYSSANENLACGEAGGHCENGYCVGEFSDSPPKVTISCPECCSTSEECTKYLGEKVNVTVLATDDVGIKQLTLSKRGEMNPSPGTPENPYYNYDCGEAKSCSNTWQITLDKVGRDPAVWDWLFYGTAQDTKDQWADWVGPVGITSIAVKPIENKKDLTKFSTKEVFLISDEDWRNILPLVPVTTWTDKNGAIQKYPTLIYHQEGNSFDADSILYFLEQYNAQELTAINSLPRELTSLINSQGLTPGLITPNDYFSYWEEFKDIVYVENDYEKALLASTYASLINAPLVIQGTSADTPKTFQGRMAILVGNVSCPSGATCQESYNLEQLQRKYLAKTNTDKVILVNPNDLNIKVMETFAPEKSSYPISELYSKTSLAAPILASAKHELIISTVSTDYQTVDSFIENKISSLGFNPTYLTIIASPDAIQMTSKPSYFREGSQPVDRYEEIDRHIYADFDHDNFSDIAVGRITSLTPSDISAYINRVLFYQQIPQSNQFASLWYPNFAEMIAQGKKIDYLLSEAGFEEHSVYAKNAGGPDSFNPKEDFQNKFYINYLNHGWFTGGGGGYDTNQLRENRIWLSPSIVVSNACGTCGYNYAKNSGKVNELFCANILRRGALVHIGAVDLSETWNISHMFLEKQMQGYDIGTAFKLSENQMNSNPYLNYEPVDILFGDPTINLNLNYPPGLEMIKTEVNTADNYIKITFPKNSNRIYINFDNTKGYVFRHMIGDSLIAYRVDDFRLSGYERSGVIQLSLNLRESIKNIKGVELTLEGETITLQEKEGSPTLGFQFQAKNYGGHKLWLALTRDKKQQQWVYVLEYLDSSAFDEFIPVYSYKIYYEGE